MLTGLFARDRVPLRARARVDAMIGGQISKDGELAQVSLSYTHNALSMHACALMDESV